jgi:hypothetical protein
MSEIKTKATAEDVVAFIEKSDPKKVEDSFKLIEIMERLSGEKATMWGPSIVGFGQYHYQYASGHKGDMCRIGFSPRKGHFSLYILNSDSPEQSKLADRLGKIKKAVACIYFKKLDDLNLDVLEKMIRQSLKETKEMWG